MNFGIMSPTDYE